MNQMTITRKVVSITIPTHIHEAGKACAASIGQSFSQFVVMATAQRISNWRDPLTGKKLAAGEVERGTLKTSAGHQLEGWMCAHPACNRPASSCKLPEKHKKDWFNEGTGEYTWTGD